MNAVSDLTSGGDRLSRRTAIVLYAVVVFLYWMSLYLYVPTLPTYVEGKVEALAAVGVVLSQYGLWQGLARLPLGIASDWLGRRKPFISVGLLCAGLGAVVMALAGDVNGLATGRALTGLAASAWVPLVVVFSAFFPPEEAVRASALLTFVGSLGRMLATALTGFINELWGYPLPFFLAGGTAVLAVLVLVPAREERHPPRMPSRRKVIALLLRRDVLLPALLSAVSQYANWAMTFGFVPILAERLGATDGALSALASMSLGLVTLGNLTATAIVRRIGARRLVYLSLALLAVGGLGAALAPNLPLLFAAQLCIGLSLGIGYPVLMGMSIERVPGPQRATAMGLHQAVYASGMFAGPWLSGILADAVGIRPTLGGTAVACLVVGILLTSLLGRAGGDRGTDEDPLG